MTSSVRGVACLLAACALPLTAATAQVANEFDFDVKQLPLSRPWNPSATVAVAHTLAASTTFTNQNCEHRGNLTVPAGVELRLVNAELRVLGNIVMQEGSRITLLDSSLFLPTQQGVPMFELQNEGGLLHTERSVIGGARNSSGSFNQSRFRHHRGTWLARHTVAQAFICLLGNGSVGYQGNLRFRGGSVFADGLYEGDLADAVHAMGMGDVSLANGTMNVGFYVDANQATAPGSLTVDLESRTPVSVTYGDIGFHSGVTSPVAAALRRLELRNHRSFTWQFFAVDATTSGPLQTITLRNANDIICNFKSLNLVGSPILGGPWSSHYAQLPGLPSTQRPGFHALPPGCSVRLGNVVIQSGSGANDWNRIRQWGLYTTGVGTNISVTGPTTFAEVKMWDGGQVHLAGSGSFDMGLLANEIELRDDAVLTINNASIGEIGTGVDIEGRIKARGNSSVTLSNCRHGRLLCYSDGYHDNPPVRPNGTPTIVAQNLFASGPVTTANLNGGTLSVPASNPALANLDFESPLAGGALPGWSLQSASATSLNDARPGSSGVSSVRVTPQAAGDSLTKSLSLPPETSVALLGYAKMSQAPANPLFLAVQNGALLAATNAVNGATVFGQWQLLQAPLLTLPVGTAPTHLRLIANGPSSGIQLDDLRLHLGSWWENESLMNLGFEGGYRFQGAGPEEWRSPDSWRGFRADCEPESAILRPGAATGSRSMKMTLTAGNYGSIRKDLRFLRPGDRIVVSGHVLGLSAANGARGGVRIFNGGTTVATTGNLNFTGAWVPFSLQYLIPATSPLPQYIRIDVAVYGVAGTQCYYDDLHVQVSL